MHQPATSNPDSNRTNPWVEALRTPLALGLAVLLGIQLLAAIALSLGDRGSLAPAALDSPLLTFDPKAVTAVRIAGGDGTAVTLARGDQGWLIADLGDFPADGAKVDALLDKLAGLKRPLPVGTSAEALKRHKVADDDLERKVTLESGDTAVATLLLGDSPGFRRIFARPAGDAAVYDLDLPLSDVSNRTDDWLARDTLQLGREAIGRIAASGWTLVKGESGWKLEGSEKAPVQSVVDDLLTRIANLSYRGVLGTEDKPEYGQGSPVLELDIELLKGESRSYRVSQIKDGQDFVLKVSDRPWYFKLSEFDLEGLKDLSLSKLTGAPSAEQDAAPAVAAPSGVLGGGTSADETATPGPSPTGAEPKVEADPSAD
jgi:Domain of unknown function (DUF4340)